AKGLKITQARDTVLQAFLSVEKHVSSDELYELARLLDPSIGQATVFRTIKLLVDAGLAQEACRDNGPRRFEHAYRHDHHDHLLCERCGSVLEFKDDTLEKAQKAVYARYGYMERSHRVELIGLCPDCAHAAAPATIGKAGTR
ncbi:MAG TPA: transcriptional repressor, partial [Spirochaetales bacterium]|nr:transcriptional repressor [Spirochaetales bacterium]